MHHARDPNAGSGGFTQAARSRRRNQHATLQIGLAEPLQGVTQRFALGMRIRIFGGNDATGRLADNLRITQHHGAIGLIAGTDRGVPQVTGALHRLL